MQARTWTYVCDPTELTKLTKLTKLTELTEAITRITGLKPVLDESGGMRSAAF